MKAICGWWTVPKKEERAKMADVLILGDGVAGLAAAITLLGQGKSVTLVRRQAKHQVTRAGESLSASALLAIRELDLDREFNRHGHMPCYGNCSSWGSDRLSYFDFIQSPMGRGWYIDRLKFDRMLLGKAKALGVAFITVDTRDTLQQKDDGWHHGYGNDSISAKLIIDASGRQAWLSRQLGIARITEDKQVAVVTLLETGAPLQNSHSLVEAVSDGWWYVADAADQTVCIFFTDPDLHERAALTNTAYWNNKKAETIFVKHRAPASRYRFVKTPELTSASSSSLRQFAGPGWFAAGDAALAMDPLSSHGLTFALRSGIDAGLAAAQSLDGDTDTSFAYDQKLRLAARLYHEKRLAIYAQETRWAEAAYWHRRHQLVLT